MLDWLRRRRKPGELPEYSAVRSVPTRELPPDLTAKEASESFSAQREVIQRSLREPPRRPPAESPLFVELLTNNETGLLTITCPGDGARCLPIFSSPVRAADYVRTLLVSGPSVTYLSSSPLQLVGMLRDARKLNIETFTLDCCPRCDVFTMLGSASVTTADVAISCWSVWKATELARLDLYLDHARTLALAGRLDVARDVALETVSHVSVEDPRAHLLLGQIAVALRNRRLLGEAQAFLRFLQLDSWERKLDQVIESGSPDFEFVE